MPKKYELQTAVLLHILHSIKSLFTIVEIVDNVHTKEGSEIKLVLYSVVEHESIWDMNISLKRRLI